MILKASRRFPSAAALCVRWPFPFRPSRLARVNALLPGGSIRRLAMPTCLIALGCNLGDRAATLADALERLDQLDSVRVLNRSRWRETVPIGGPEDQPAFLNGAATLETSRSPQCLLETLQELERKLGRQRDVRWGPRAIDLDLLLYGGVSISTTELTIPHPRMTFRRFVLEPAAEVAPKMVHPQLGWTVARLLEHQNTAAPFIDVAGDDLTGGRSLAQRVAGAVDAPLLSTGALETDLHRPRAGGQIWLAAVKCLQRQAELLADVAGGDASRPAICDFSFDQLPRLVAPRLAPSQQGEFRRLWREARRKIDLAKLTFICGSTELPPRGPSLTLPVDEAEAQREAIAAWRAIRQDA